MHGRGVEVEMMIVTTENDATYTTTTSLMDSTNKMRRG